MQKHISRFHFITHEVPGFSHVELAEAACKGGADWIQLRVKDKGFEEWKSIALDVIEVCEMYNAKLIINDNVELAAQIRAYGVHLGKTDMSPIQARQILGSGYVIGGTANTYEDILKLSREGVDYIGLGPFRFTSTKKNLSPVLGIEGYQRIITRMNHEDINIPIVAIGGILKEHLNHLFSTGIHGVAVSSGVSSTEDKVKATAEYLKTIKKLIHA